MTTEAASLALAQDKHDRDLEEHHEWVATYPHAIYDPFVED